MSAKTRTGSNLRNQPAPAPTPLETLVGTVERVTFHNADTGFAVIRVKARGRRDLVTVVGHAATIGAGEFVTASGTWITDRTHGLQFKAQVMKATPPTGAEGIEKYLASGQMRGIGPAMAKRIVSLFGDATFDIIEAEPDRLKEVAGIGPKRAERIVAGWAEQKAVREIMIFLHAHGVGTARAVRIFKTYGHDAIAVMTDDPYRLARDIRGIGFRTADSIAAKLGMEKTAPQRLRAGVSFALQEAMDEGHCGLPQADLVKLAEKLLEVDAPLTEQTGIEAKTLHRLLEVDPANGGFKKGLESLLVCDLLVVDETSMVDVPLMNALLKAVPPGAGLLLVGDVDQLPSVGPGQVLSDIILSQAIPTARLTEVFRQAATSRITASISR